MRVPKYSLACSTDVSAFFTTSLKPVSRPSAAGRGRSGLGSEGGRVAGRRRGGEGKRGRAGGASGGGGICSGHGLSEEQAKHKLELEQVFPRLVLGGKLGPQLVEQGLRRGGSEGLRRRATRGGRPCGPSRTRLEDGFASLPARALVAALRCPWPPRVACSWSCGPRARPRLPLPCAPSPRTSPASGSCSRGGGALSTCGRPAGRVGRGSDRAVPPQRTRVCPRRGQRARDKCGGE